MNPDGVHLNFARDPVLFIIRWTLNELPLLRIFTLFPLHHMTKHSCLRAKMKEENNCTQFSYWQRNSIIGTITSPSSNHIEKNIVYFDVTDVAWVNVFITKTCLFKYTENFTTKKKKWKFSDKKFWYFHVPAQNINCGYSLEPPQLGGSNEYPQSMFWADIRKLMYTPVNPSFII